MAHRRTASDKKGSRPPFVWKVGQSLGAALREFLNSAEHVRDARLIPTAQGPAYRLLDDSVFSDLWKEFRMDGLCARAEEYAVKSSSDGSQCVVQQEIGTACLAWFVLFLAASFSDLDPKRDLPRGEIEIRIPVPGEWKADAIGEGLTEGLRMALEQLPVRELVEGFWTYPQIAAQGEEDAWKRNELSWSPDHSWEVRRAVLWPWAEAARQRVAIIARSFPHLLWDDLLVGRVLDGLDRVKRDVEEHRDRVQDQTEKGLLLMRQVYPDRVTNGMVPEKYQEFIGMTRKEQGIAIGRRGLDPGHLDEPQSEITKGVRGGGIRRDWRHGKAKTKVASLEDVPESGRGKGDFASWMAAKEFVESLRSVERELLERLDAGESQEEAGLALGLGKTRGGAQKAASRLLAKISKKYERF